MTAVPLGRGAYKRLYAGSPEIKLLNRWLEPNPANLVENTAVLARPGTTPTLTFDPGEDFTGVGPMRGNYVLNGLFDDAMFVVCGTNLYRVATDMTKTHIAGVIQGNAHPETAWQKGIGYERLWIADGLLLQFYQGTSHSNVDMTFTGSVTPGTTVFEVGGTYYGFGTTFSPSDAGTSSNPFIIDPKTSVLDQIVKAVLNAGVPGDDYSDTIGGPNSLVSASVSNTDPTILTFTALLPGVGGDTITSTAVGPGLTFAHPTLTNGGIEVLQGCEIPDGQTALSLAQVSGYVLVSISNSQKFYWINPGETTIDPLNFASKESSPDNIIAMRTLGDQVGIIGEKSFENWYATGNNDAPFAPIEGRVYARGVYPGTACVVDDSILLVGDDGRVYGIGYQSGDATDIGWGVTRISNNGIEERVRRQIRREQGLKP